jgi:hypothetical protein
VTSIPRMFQAPLPIATWLAMGLLLAAVSDVAQVLTAAGRLRTHLDDLVLRSLAESATFAALASSGQRTVVGSARDYVLSTEFSTGSPVQVVVARGGANVATFACDVLPGAVAESLALPFALVEPPPICDGSSRATTLEPPPRIAARASWPALAPEVDQAREPDEVSWLRRDSAIALARLSSGTDLPDFVLKVEADGVVRPAPSRSGVRRIDGHLWIDCGTEPLVVELDRDVTLVVRGNLYVGRSVAVRGPGRLTFVVQRGTGHRFRDSDGDGRWSPGESTLDAPDGRLQGPIEGGGAVYLGLPRDESAERIEIAASLVVEGDVVLLREEAHVRGNLLGGASITSARGARRLSVGGLGLRDVRRDRIPGFVSQGPPRPGALRRL